MKVKREQGKRNAFQRMIQDAKDGKIDIIITKSISDLHVILRRYCRRLEIKKSMLMFTSRTKHSHITMMENY